MVRRSLVSPSLCIHDKYIVGGGTYIESVRVIYNYVSNVLSEEVANNLLSRFELHPNVLMNDSLMVNSDLINDLLGYILNELHLDKSDLLFMAISGFSSRKRQEVLESGLGKGSDYDTANEIVKNSEKFEVNFDYNIEKLNDKYFRINTISREQSNDRMKKAEIATQDTIDYKTAIIKVFYSLTGQIQPKILEVESNISNGRQTVNYLFKETKLTGKLIH